MITKCEENQSRARLSPGLFVLATVFVWLATGCQPTTPPVTTVPTPVIGEPRVGAPTPLRPGEEVGISVEISSAAGVTLSYTWYVDGGEIIRGQGSPAITYRAPQLPGTYNIRVVTNWDDQGVEKITSIKVTTPTVPPSRGPSPTAIAQTPIATVQIGDLYSVIQLTTGLNVRVFLDYNNKVTTGNDVLDHILSGCRSLGSEHLVLEITDDVYRIIPLRLFLHASAEPEGKQSIALATGEEIEGWLVGRLPGPDGEEYDLRSAAKAILISLSESDSNVEPSETEPEGMWRLEIFDPVGLSYRATNPRFAFQYGTFSPTGSYHYHERTTQAFELEVNDTDHLANLLDFDEITFSEEGTTVKIGDTETQGRLFLRAGSDGFFTTDRHYSWFLVADLIDREGAIAVWNGNKSVMTLRKASD